MFISSDSSNCRFNVGHMYLSEIGTCAVKLRASYLSNVVTRFIFADASKRFLVTVSFGIGKPYRKSHAVKRLLLLREQNEFNPKQEYSTTST